MKKYLILTLFLILTTACGGLPETEPPAAVDPATSAATESAYLAPESVEQQTPTEDAAYPATESTVEEVPTQPTVEPTELLIESIEVTYFTPAQAEGPYYTVEKPADRDNDLTVLAGASGQPAGQVMEFSGKLYNANGDPIEGAVIQIWQTDHSGVYLHPNDPGTGQRDTNFQFYGEATTRADGGYWFRTILPGKYEPRPVHIHFKVFIAGREVLTSQFYFQGDPSLDSDGIFVSAGSESAALIISLYEGADANGVQILLGERDIILDIE